VEGDPQSDSVRLAPRSYRWNTEHLKAFSTVSLFLADVAMLVTAFILGYEARESLPFFARPQDQPPIANFVPTIVLHVTTIILMFYFSRLYHLKRASSRIDQFRNVLGVVTLGTLLASGIQEFVLQNTAFEAIYPRSLLFYVWFFSMLHIGLGREVHRRIWAFLRRQGVLRDNLLIVGEGRIATRSLKKSATARRLDMTLWAS